MLPVPVPIPVPVPYIIPIPASLWAASSADFAAAAASSMISSRGEETTSPVDGGDFKVRAGEQSAPWFTWHPRFNQHFYAGKIDSRLAATAFDPATFVFRPDQAQQGVFSIATFAPAEESNDVESSSGKKQQRTTLDANKVPQQTSKNDDAAITGDGGLIEEANDNDNDNEMVVNVEQPPVEEESKQHSDTASSSGRSSADSSDLEDSSSSHRFSRVFVVNDDSLTSDNEAGDEHDSDSVCKEPALLRKVNVFSDEEPVILRHVRLLSEDSSEICCLPKAKSEVDESLPREAEEERTLTCSGNVELYLADSDDYSDNCIQLKSIKTLDPDSMVKHQAEAEERGASSADEREEEEESIVPDSLEVGYRESIIAGLDDSRNSTSEITTGTGSSEISSDELHEYEVNPPGHTDDDESMPSKAIVAAAAAAAVEQQQQPTRPKRSHRNVSDIISGKIQEIFNNVESSSCRGGKSSLHDEPAGSSSSHCPARGEKSVGGGGSRQVGVAAGGDAARQQRTSSIEEQPPQSVERRPPTRKDNAAATSRDSRNSNNNFPQQAASSANNNNNSNKYKSLVMITQGTAASYQPVSVVTSDMTTLLQPDSHQTSNNSNNSNSGNNTQGLAGYFQLALEAAGGGESRKSGAPPRRPLMVKRFASAAAAIVEQQEADSGLSVGSASESDDVLQQKCNSNNMSSNSNSSQEQQQQQQPADSAAVAAIIEEGLADDDSWVEEVSHDEDEQATTATEESSEDEANNLGDREEELRGYHRQAIDFTLHTIVEESCEESEAEQPSFNSSGNSPCRKVQRPPSTSELEKYFFFGLGGENGSASYSSREIDSLSETSSIYSEGLESLGQEDNNGSGGPQLQSSSSGEGLNSSRLEKYFLSEFLGFDQEDRRDSDGSVGSDSEGRPSPEAQRRKRLVRARGTGRSHSSSLDNLLALTQQSSQNSLTSAQQNSLQDLSLNQDLLQQETQSEGSSTETDGAEDGQQTPAFGSDGQFDTIKRKKKKPRNLGTQSPRVSDDRNKTPEPSRDVVAPGVESEQQQHQERKTEDTEITKESGAAAASCTTSETMRTAPSTSAQRNKQQSRDSGFVGSCDDLLVQQHQKQSPDEANNKNPDNNSKSADGKDAKRDHHHLLPSKQHHQRVNSEKTTDKSEASTTGGGGSTLPSAPPNASLSRKDSFNNWSSDEETNLMMSKMRQFFKTMVATSSSSSNVVQGQEQRALASNNSAGASPAPSPRLYTSVKSGGERVSSSSQSSSSSSNNRTKPPQLVYFENELTRLMKTVPGIRDEQVREIVEYLSSEDTWSDSYDSSDYTSSDLEGAAAASAAGQRSALQEQISQSCQQIINKFDTNNSQQTDNSSVQDNKRCLVDNRGGNAVQAQPCFGRDTAFVYQKLVQSFTKMAGENNVSSDTSSTTPHSSPPLIAKVMHHIGSRLVALMHEVSEGGSAVVGHPTSWRRYSQHHHRAPSSASTTEDDDSTSDSTNAPPGHQLPRSKSHDPLHLINNYSTTQSGQEGEEREASDYERFSWRGSFESALMAADSRTKLSLLACSGDVNVAANGSTSALVMAAKRRSAGDLLFNQKSFSREQLDRVRSCGSIGGGNSGVGSGGGSIEERIWSNRRRSSVPDANTRESGEFSYLYFIRMTNYTLYYIPKGKVLIIVIIESTNNCLV